MLKTLLALGNIFESHIACIIHVCFQKNLQIFFEIDTYVMLLN